MVTRTEAVTRIRDGLGFFTSTTQRDARIVLRLQEAQRDLEKGKTLPSFLLEEDYEDTLVAGDHTIALPTGFIRMKDEERPHIVRSTSDTPFFLMRKTFYDAQTANIGTENDPQAPTVYVMRKDTIDFINTADVDYTIIFSYYKSAVSLASDNENAWLANAPEWLIGEAGYRMAFDGRNKSAMDLFDDMRKRGRAATFGEQIASEEADGPFIMGADL